MTARPPNMGQEAQRLAAWFWIFPLGPQSKSPLKDTAGCHGALRNRKLIAALWQAEPRANIGIATGKQLDKDRKLLVIDPDAPGGDHGTADGRIYVAAHPELFPETVRVETPTGGAHRYYSYPADLHITNSDVMLPPGINVRGEGGYVVAPASVHPNGGIYQWADGCAPWEREITPAPLALLALLCPPPDPPATTPRPPAPPQAGEHWPAPEHLVQWGRDNTQRLKGRNNTAFRLGRQVWANGYEGSAGEGIVLDYAGGVGLPAHEARRCWRSALTYDRLDPWERGRNGPSVEDTTPLPAELVAAGESGVDVAGPGLDAALLTEIATLRDENNALRAALEQEHAARLAAEQHARHLMNWQKVPNVVPGVRAAAPFVVAQYKQRVQACEADSAGWVSISLPAVVESQAGPTLPAWRERTAEEHKAVASRAEQLGIYIRDMATYDWIETKLGPWTRSPSGGQSYRPVLIRPKSDAFLSDPLALPTPEKRAARPRKPAAICPKCHTANTRQVVAYECLAKGCRHIFREEEALNAAELIAPAATAPTPPTLTAGAVERALTAWHPHPQDPILSDLETDGALDPIISDLADTAPAEAFRIRRNAVYDLVHQHAAAPAGPVPCPDCSPWPCVCWRNAPALLVAGGCIDTQEVAPWPDVA